MNVIISKFHGAGNDFLILSEIEKKLCLSAQKISLLCDRHLGIGADGLIVIKHSAETDFCMQFFNSDGGEASMCGNGARCAVAWADDHGMIVKNSFFAADGMHSGKVLNRNKNIWSVQVSLNINSETEILNDKSFFANTGVPHNVRIVDDADEIDINEEGPKFRNHKMFKPQGANVNFVSVGEKTNRIRTFERGVEGETLACGTGCAAAALVLNKYFGQEFPILLKANGGDLTIDVQNSQLFISGPAIKVFEAQINLEEI